MPIVKYDFQPGIIKEGTDYSSEGQYRDGNLVRFKQGHPEKVGGWAKNTADTTSGIPRRLMAWSNNTGVIYTGIGTTCKLYVKTTSALEDVTPIHRTVILTTDPLTTTAASATITVTHVAHQALVGDSVILSGATATDGIPASEINAEHVLVSTPDADSYTITVTTTASAGTTGGGAITADYLLPCGTDTAIDLSGGGWGTVAWGAGGFGDITSYSFTGQLRLWSIDNFGEDLVACPRGGEIYTWDASVGVGSRAVPISSLAGADVTPTSVLQVIVSDRARHVIALGCDPLSGGARTGVIDPMLIAWSDAENMADWNPALNTNLAGEIPLSSGSYIVGGIKTRQELLVFTDTSVFSLNLIGGAAVYGVEVLSEQAGLLGMNAVISSPGGVLWMSQDNFYIYDGSVSTLDCPVWSHVFGNLNVSQGAKAFAGVNKKFNEVWWFYPTSGAENDRCVVFNYKDGTWWIGQLVRSAWTDSSVTQYPLASHTNGTLYDHEALYGDDGSAMSSVYLETADTDIGDGQQLMFVKRILPDIKFGTSGKVNVKLKVRDFPNETMVEKADKSTTSSTLQHHVRARGRQAAIRYESADTVEFTIGSIRLDAKPDGRR